MAQRTDLRDALRRDVRARASGWRGGTTARRIGWDKAARRAASSSGSSSA